MSILTNWAERTPNIIDDDDAAASANDDAAAVHLQQQHPNELQTASARRVKAELTAQFVGVHGEAVATMIWLFISLHNSRISGSVIPEARKVTHKPTQQMLVPIIQWFASTLPKDAAAADDVDAAASEAAEKSDHNQLSIYLNSLGAGLTNLTYNKDEVVVNKRGVVGGGGGDGAAAAAPQFVVTKEDFQAVVGGAPNQKKLELVVTVDGKVSKDSALLPNALFAKIATHVHGNSNKETEAARSTTVNMLIALYESLLSYQLSMRLKARIASSSLKRARKAQKADGGDDGDDAPPPKRTPSR